MIKKFKHLFKSHFRIILYFILNVLLLLIHLLSTQTLTSKLSISDYGSYSLVLSIAGLVSLLGVSWTASSIVYVGVREYQEQNSLSKTLSARIFIVLLFSLPIIVVVLVLKYRINNFLKLSGTNLILIYYALSIIVTTISNYLLAINRQIGLTIIELISSVIILLLLLLRSITTELAIIYNLIGQSSILLGLVFFRKADLSVELDKKYLKKVFVFSLSQLLGFLGGYLINYGGNLIINYYLTKEDLGIFNLSFRLFSNISSLILLVNTFYAATIVSIITEKNKKQIKHFYYKVRPIFILIFFMGIIFSMIVGPYVILLIFKEKYAPSIKPFVILLLALIPLSIEVFYISVYNTLNKHLILQIIIISQAALSMVLMFILIPLIGIYGAVWSIVISYFVKTIFSYLYLEKKILHLLTH